MAIATKGSMGVGASSTNNTTLAMTTTTTALAVGDVAILTIASDNVIAADGDNAEVTGVADSAGNTWEKLGAYSNGDAGAGAGVLVSVWRAKCTVALAIGGTITATFSGARTDKCCSAWAYTVASGATLSKWTGGTNPITSEVNAANGFGSSVFSGLPSLSRLWFRGLAKEANSTTANTVSASFTNITPNRSRNNASAVIVRGEFRISTSTGETSNPTLAVSGDSAGVFLALEETLAPATGTASQTLGAATQVATGVAPIAGSAAQTLAAVAQTATGTAPALTPTEVVRYVNRASTPGGDGTTNATAGASRAYAGVLEAWTSEVAARPDLVSNNEQLRILCCGATTDAYTADLDLTGFTSDATRYVSIEGNAAEADGRHAGVWSTSRYRITLAGAVWISLVNQSFVRFVGLQIEQTTDVFWFLSFGDNCGGGRVDGCLIRGSGLDGFACVRVTDNGSNIAPYVFSDNVVYNASIGFYTNAHPSAIYALNNTVYGMTQRGIFKAAGAGAFIARNNYAASCAAECFTGTFDAPSGNNYSDDGSNGSTTLAASTGAPTYFTNLTPGSEDFHIGSASSLRGAGADLSALIALDVDNDARSAWDVGADEFSGASTVTGTAAQTLNAVTQSATGVTPIAGSAGQSLAAVTQTADVDVIVAGSAAQAVGAVAQTATATATASGSAAQALSAVTQTAIATAIAGGTAAQSLGSVTQAATAVAPVVGSAAQTPGAVTQAATAVTPVTGSATQALAAVAQTSTAAARIDGSASQALGGVTQAATAELPALGSASQAIDPVTQVAAAVAAIAAAATQLLDAVTQAAAGVLPVSASAGQTLDPVTVDASGTTLGATSGSAAQTLAPVTQVATAEAPIAASAAQSLGEVAQAATATVRVDATASQSLGAIAQVASAVAIVSGAASQLLDAVTQVASAVAADVISGAAAQTLDPVAQTAAAVTPIAATAAQPLDPVVVAGSGVLPIVGSAAQTLDVIAQVATGALPVSAIGAQAVAAVTQVAIMANGGLAPQAYVVPTLLTPRITRPSISSAPAAQPTQQVASTSDPGLSAGRTTRPRLVE